MVQPAVRTVMSTTQQTGGAGGRTVAMDATELREVHDERTGVAVASTVAGGHVLAIDGGYVVRFVVAYL